MKKFICTLLILAIALGALSACDRKTITPEPSESQAVDFSPEVTAISSGGLTQAAEAVEAPTEEAQPSEEQPVAEDSAITQEPAPEAEATQAPTDAPAAQPFATATPQPNTAVSTYSEVAASGLGFKFSYPSNWTNIPGRSTVCYVQPLENGTVYPARVAVTMKKLDHKCNAYTKNEHTTELADYIKLLRAQYDESRFEVNMTLDEETKFMGNSAISTSYLAYDGDQEIQGYVILTYFERYLFVFHFLCAYEDYAAFEPVMRHMRDSVQPDQNLLNN